MEGKLKRKIEETKEYKGHALDMLTLEAAAYVANMALDAIEIDVRFYEGTIEQQRAYIDELELRNKKTEKESEFYKKIIGYFVDR